MRRHGAAVDFPTQQQTSAKAAKGRGGKSPARQAPLADTQNPADTAEALREVRARARTRLMGATVLLLVGVIGFPLLFETQPRPIPVDLPIEIPARNAPAVVDASSHARARRTAAGAARCRRSSRRRIRSYDARSSAPRRRRRRRRRPDACSAFASLASALDVQPPARGRPPRPTSRRPWAAPLDRRAGQDGCQARQAAPRRPRRRAAASRPAPLHTAGAGAAAAARLEAVARGDPGRRPRGQAVRTPPPRRPFVVQVGAFLEDAKVREARAKVEKLGIKTYTQPVDTPTGKRIRVRVGPFATKAEADELAARLKADGLQAVVLAL